MRAGTKRRLRLLLLVLSLSVVIGVMIGGATASMHGPALFRLVLGALSGAITAAMLALVIGGAEIFLPHTRLGQAFDRGPFVVASRRNGFSMAARSCSSSKAWSGGASP